MSSSVILTKQLEIESVELKSYISDFFDEKAKEFTGKMKQKIGQFVNDRILSFYNGPSHDMTLFDKEGALILERIEEQFRQRNWIQVIEENKAYLHQKNKMCFKIQQHSVTYNFFEKCVIVCGEHCLYPCSEKSGFSFTIVPHRLSHDMLRTIKHFQLDKQENLEIGLSIYKNHPEFFKYNCTDFEEVCTEEYKLIDLKNKELDQLIKEAENIEKERKKLEKEKIELFRVRQKLSLMKLELDKERYILEKKKEVEKRYNIDRYFEDIF